MDAPQFSRLVAGHEIDSQFAPARFRRRTALWALLGYAAIWVVLVACVVGLVALAQQIEHVERAAAWQIGLGAVGALLLYSVLRALWAPVPAPPGRVLTRADAPRLFALIDKLRRRTGGPRIDRVRLDGQLNAGVVQQPRLGVLGWHRNHLVIGLPLLMSLDLRQFVAVLAHEYGHLSGAHGRLSGWVYRTRRSWMRLAQSRRETRSGGSIADSVLAVFLDHYFPHFNARAVVLGRRQEYEADAAAQRLAGRAAAAQSLVQIGLATRFLDEVFWPQVWRGAIGSSRPTASPYAAMADTLGRVSRLPQAPRWLQQAWKATPHADDTHPSLRQRLEFAGQQPALPPPVRRSAASALLGSGLNRWCRAFDETWRREHRVAWLQEAQRFADERSLRASLRAHAARHALSPDEALRLARCTATLEGDAAGRVALKQALATHPRHAPTRHALALVKLASESRARQAQGHALLQEIAEGEGPLAIDALERSIAWLESQDRPDDEIEPLRASLEDKRARQRETDADHHDFDRPQAFDAPQVSPRLQRAALSVLKRDPAIGAAWLVRKRCEQGSPAPFHVMLIERSRQRQPADADAWRHALRQRLDLPGDWMLIDAAHRHWTTPARTAVLAQLRKTPGARLDLDR